MNNLYVADQGKRVTLQVRKAGSVYYPLNPLAQNFSKLLGHPGCLTETEIDIIAMDLGYEIQPVLYEPEVAKAIALYRKPSPVVPSHSLVE